MPASPTFFNGLLGLVTHEPTARICLITDTIMIKLHTNHGVITLKLFADKAPETVANFEQYVKEGHYTAPSSTA